MDNLFTQQANDFGFGNGTYARKDFDLDRIILKVKHYNGSMNSKHTIVVYKQLVENPTHAVYDFHRNILLGVDKHLFKNKIQKIGKDQVCKYLDNLVIFRNVNYSKYKAEGLFGDYGFFDTIKNLCRTVGNIRTMADSFNMEEFAPWLADVLAFLLEFVDNNRITVSKLFMSILRLYSLIQRVKNWKDNTFTPQSLMEFSFTDIAFAFSLLGLPAKVLKVLSSFSLLTGKKLTDTHMFTEIFGKFLDCVIGILEWIRDTLNLKCLDTVISLLLKVFSFVDTYRLMKRVTEAYTEYVKNPQRMFDPLFRNNVLSIGDLCKNINFQEYVANESNKCMQSTYKAFTQNVLKQALTFDVSERKEPICFVFEGAPASGKSVLMNSFVSLLKEANKSVYIHTVPPTAIGKDFYDDYENQDVFVMDDVGQQGISQWRTIINFVAPVKYPLDCATAEKKNTKFFNSNIILCTTNHFEGLHGFTSADAISEPEALFRRVHLIKVDRTDNIQKLTYKKYDLKTRQWKNSFLFPWRNDLEEKGIPVQVISSQKQEHLRWLYMLCSSLEKTQKETLESFSLDPKDAQAILKRCNGKWKCEVISFNKERDEVNIEDDGNFDSLSNEWLGLYEGPKLVKEWVCHVFSTIKDYFRESIETLKEKMTHILSPVINQVSKAKAHIKEAVVRCVVAFFAPLIMGGILTGFFAGFSALDKKITDDNLIVTFRKKNKEAMRMEAADFEEVVFNKRNNTDEYIDTYLGSVNDKFKFVTVHSTTGLTDRNIHCQAAISGKNVLLPYHAVGTKNYITVYKDWNAYINNFRILDYHELEVVKAYPAYDIVVCRLKGMIKNIFPKNKILFRTQHNKERANDLYYVNCEYRVPLKYGGNASLNTKSVEYKSMHGTIKHGEGTGLTYDISCEGLCGSLVISVTEGWIGMHVAGTSKKGFAVIPASSDRMEIAKYMLEGPEEELKLMDKDYEDFSGARIRYEKGDIKPAFGIQSTSFQPTSLHVDVNSDMKSLIDQLGDKGTVVKEKLPPIFDACGTTKKTLETISKKSFKPLGKVSGEELEFGIKYLDTLLCEFDDISHQEVAFGNEDLAAMNKDSSNGYGWDVKKCEVLDFENKTIQPDFLKEMEDFEKRCKDNAVEVSDLLARETFKDELRVRGKETTPRTFRVLPVQHIWYTKKCLGKLSVHIKKNRHSSGIALGLNPYTEWQTIYDKLRLCSVVFDIDFGKWDGSLHARVQQEIHDLVLRKYKGNHKECLKVILDSIVKGYVLVSDALFYVTHGMPSGTWVTFLFNSLFNKCITAMAIYRAMKKAGKAATIEDVNKVVDYVAGDDKCCGAPKEMENYFNAFTVKEIAEDLGMDCTDGQKKPVITKGVNMKDLVFLKRQFKEHLDLGKVVGPLDISTILNTLQWYDGTKEYDSAMLGKSIATQIEAYQHSPELASKIYDIVSARFPFTPLIDKKIVQRILNSPLGYATVCEFAGKDINYML